MVGQGTNLVFLSFGRIWHAAVIIGDAQPRIVFILYAERLRVFDNCFMLCLKKTQREKVSVLRKGSISCAGDGGFQRVGMLVMIS